MKEFLIRFQIIVKDYGVGIPTEKIKHLFVNFGKLDEN